MARKKHHEEHANHEAWAIPYGDLITLLLAFFVVMYAVSSINEGKYRVLSESLKAAFKGGPRSLSPVQIGDPTVGGPRAGTSTGIGPTQALDLTASTQPSRMIGDGSGLAAQLSEMADELESVMEPLIDDELIAVNREGGWVEVEIKTDILFPSGSAQIQPKAEALLQSLSDIVAPLPNTIRVEGHTDTRPISTARFPSNWELSAARAARIVREFETLGIDSARLVVAGMGEHHPVADNGTTEGRSRNRRVAVVILDGFASDPDGERLSTAAGNPFDQAAPSGKEAPR